LALGKTVAEIDTMSERELSDWAAFFSIRPMFPHELQTAIGLAVMTGKEPEKFIFSDYTPHTPPQTSEPIDPKMLDKLLQNLFGGKNG
jgi:hypothetical protein